MNRTKVVQAILDQRSDPVYLEIGVEKGENFFPIKARQKIAVDPRFRISTIRKAAWLLGNASNRSAKYHQETSDSYFSNPRYSCQLDVVFIDGLHTHQQSLKDVNNSLRNLKNNGVIVMHDCNPPNAAAAHPANSYDHAASLNLPGWTGEWCGDVWKTISCLRGSRKDLRVFVLDCDCGVGIITRGKPDDNLSLLQQDIDRMSYDEFSQDRKKLLNLRDESFLIEFLKSI